MRCVALLVAVVLAILFGWDRPAAAHGAGGDDATSYVTTVDGITPELPGVTVGVVEAGAGLELRNRGAEVVVLGYWDEPYLRVGPDGAFENRLSPTVAANRGEDHVKDAPPANDPAAAPEWRKVSAQPVVRWHDHRVHWSGPNPPDVEARPGERHVVQPPWQVGLRRGPDAAVLAGQLTWVPGPSPVPWSALAAAAFAGVAALGLLRRWGPPLAAAVGVLLAADLVHAGGAAFAGAGGLSAHLGRMVTGGFYSIVGWVLAGVALRLLSKGRVDGLYAGVFAGLSIAVFGGLLDITTLWHSTAPFALPLDIARLCIAVAAGGGFGLAAACLLVIRRTPEARGVVGGGGPGREDEAADGAGDVPPRHSVGANGAGRLR